MSRMHLRALFTVLSVYTGLTAAGSGDVPVIRSVIIERLPVLTVPDDPRLAGVIRFANRINGQTREYVIRQELLFAPGNPLDTAVLQETARNLRAIKNFGEVTVVSSAMSGDSTDIIVRVRDKWTKLLELAYQQDGGVREAYTAARDNNLLGTGRRLGMQLNYRSDRNKPLGYAASLEAGRLFGTRWDGAVGYGDDEELTRTSASVTRPFYAQRACWSGGTGWSESRVLERQYDGGEVEREREYRYRAGNVWGIRRFHGPVRTYAGGAYVYRSATGDSLPAIPDIRYHAFNGSFTIASTEYREARFFNNFGRIEDVATGFAVSAGAGVNAAENDGSLYRTAYTAEAAAACFPLPAAYVSAAAAGGILMGGVPGAEHWLRATLRAAYRLPFRQTLAFRLTGTARNGTARDRTDLYLDSPNGLRGFPVYGLGGRSRVVCNIENRLFSPVRIWFMHVGAGVFYDGGMVLDAGEDLQSGTWHSSFGGGLRFENPTQRGSGIIRFEVAFNGDTGRFSEVMITSGNLFSVFESLSVLNPASVNSPL